ncbi:Proton-translocating NADH-quinone oxidoreductase subunit L [Planctomycetales bacterium 10988]|nr:Proton-translocating NADH-quinone oxidoreductase subunit L [Planctomycetales bacterium 10988]
MNLDRMLPLLLGGAWLLPLLAFAIIALGGHYLKKTSSQHRAGFLSTVAILGSFVLAVVAFSMWVSDQGLGEPHHGPEFERAQLEENQTPIQLAALAEEGEAEHAHDGVFSVSGVWYIWAQVGEQKFEIGYYIDALTICLFVMITLVASCIHFFSLGYLQEELETGIKDHLVATSAGEPFERVGRQHRFFQYLSLFCFSMLGLVLAGNLLMVFIFWELVGICSYFLIGFYFERKAAQDAANKAFLVNRIGDLGFLVGIMALWGVLGTLTFGEMSTKLAELAPETQQQASPNKTTIQAASFLQDEEAKATNDEETADWNVGLLILAGLGIFCGCVGKSAQFPLHVWLPDAMEGPTPVSALVHSATMVAAGVYLVARCYPLFTEEVLLVIAYIGVITLLMAAMMALVAVDIKRVLAFSTISQLGYMMLALGVGGWSAGVFHLITHAFFKSLLFLGAGAVIHALHHEQLLIRMGGLRHKMPWTAGMMFVGCLAIAGAGIPGLDWGLSGYFSKDALLAQAYAFAQVNPSHVYLYWLPLAGKALTAFYIFRLWYLTFAGKPREKKLYENAHEAPLVMLIPMMVLTYFAITAGWQIPFTPSSVTTILEQALPAVASFETPWAAALNYPAEYLSHQYHTKIAWTAIATAGTGFLLATIFYVWQGLRPDEVQKQFGPLFRFLQAQLYLNEVYHFLFVRPLHGIARACSWIDRHLIDPFVDRMAKGTVNLARLEDQGDRKLIDRPIDWMSASFYDLAVQLKATQTGMIRQYLVFLVLGTVGFFFIVGYLWQL